MKKEKFAYVTMVTMLQKLLSQEIAILNWKQSFNILSVMKSILDCPQLSKNCSLHYSK